MGMTLRGCQVMILDLVGDLSLVLKERKEKEEGQAM